MEIVNKMITRSFDLLLTPLSGHPWVGLIVISLFTGGVLLLVFRYTSNQRGIRRTKNRIVSHLLEVLLYRDEMSVVLRAQARLVVDNAKYLGYALVPLIFMIVPVGFLLVQTDLRYGHRPLRVGEKTILAVRLAPSVDLDSVSLSTPEGIAIETEGLRIPALHEVDWRVRAVTSGRHELGIHIGDQEFSKQIIVGDVSGRISQARVNSGLWERFLNPGETPIPEGVPARSATIAYPSAELEAFGRPMHWVWPWLIISMIFGYALKGPLRVQV